MSRRLLIPILVLVGLIGCGKKGPPRPPLPPFPAEPPAAHTRQAGEMVELMLTLPTRRLDGRAIDAFRGLKIFRRVEPAPREGDAPVVVARRPAMGEVEPVKVLSAAEVADLVPGGTFWLREPVAGVLGAHEPDASFRVTYWARFLLKGGGWSPPTRPVSLLSGVVVPAPAGLSAGTLNQGIQLSWTSAGSGLATAVYRRDPEDSFPFQPMTMVPAGQMSFVDPTVAVGRTYVYGVRATWENDPAAPMSDMMGPVEILMEDHFPPAPPEDLQALVRPDGVDLFWLAGQEMDLAGYRVWWRPLPAGSWTLLTPAPIAGTSFTHDQVRVGEPAEYAVSAVDRNEPPNESPRGIPVTAEAPMAPPPAREEMP